MTASKKDKPSRAPWMIVTILVVILIVGFFVMRGSGGGDHRYGKVKRGDIIQRVTASGLVRPLRKTAFIAPAAGYVVKLFVHVGQKVKANDPIVSLKSSLQSPEQVFPLRTPFGGTVVDVTKMEGEYVNEKDAKDVIARVDDDSKFFIVARAPELDVTRVKKGMEVEIKVSAIDSPPLKGIVRDIALAAQEADGWKNQQATFDIRVEVLNPPEKLRSGQSAILDIVTGKIPDVLYLEHEFINQEGDKYFIVNRAGKHIPIEVGRQSDSAVEIKSGLKEGDEAEQVDFLKLLESGS